MISVGTQVVFEGQPTTTEEREALMRAGFVHVTGLEFFPPCFRKEGAPRTFIGERLKPDECGNTANNNGKTVIVTKGGEIWLAVAGYGGLKGEILKQLCPHANGAFVPLSNGEQVNCSDLLRRLRDPDWNLKIQA